MKTCMLQLRIDSETKEKMRDAAIFDRRSMASFCLAAVDRYMICLRARGWKAKPAPAPRDARRKTA